MSNKRLKQIVQSSVLILNFMIKTMGYVEQINIDYGFNYNLYIVRMIEQLHEHLLNN